MDCRLHLPLSFYFKNCLCNFIQYLHLHVSCHFKALLCLCICLIGLAQFQFNIICKLGDREWRWPLYSLPQFGLRRIGLDRIGPTRPEIFTVNTDCVLRGDRSSGLFCGDKSQFHRICKIARSAGNSDISVNLQSAFPNLGTSNWSEKSS